MRRIERRALKICLQRLLLVFCALYLSGAHWAVLRVTAWTGMVVERAETSSILKAMETTLDGRHPCRMCMALNTAQEEEQKQKLPGSGVQKFSLDSKWLPLAQFTIPASASSGCLSWKVFNLAASCRTEAPPVPPPLPA